MPWHVTELVNDFGTVRGSRVQHSPCPLGNKYFFSWLAGSGYITGWWSRSERICDRALEPQVVGAAWPLENVWLT